MLNVKLIVVGKLKEAYLRDASAEYIKRLGAFCTLKVIELDEYKLPKNPSQKDIDKSLDTEADAIFKEAQGYIIPLCIEGRQMTSEELSDKLSSLGVNGYSTVSFIIGSSHGLNERVKEKADYKFSMSKMTFPHQIARVMLLEQIYRAFMIASGGQYHK